MNKLFQIYRAITTVKEDKQLIELIAKKVDDELMAKGLIGYDRMGAILDLEIIHHFYPMDLAGMLAGPYRHRLHDMAGIKGRMDRDTGHLIGQWIPRYSIERTPQLVLTPSLWPAAEAAAEKAHEAESDRAAGSLVGYL